MIIIICDALHDLVPFVQFKKCEKHPWRSCRLLKVTLLHGCFSRFLNLQMVTNGVKHLIYTPFSFFTATGVQYLKP